MGTNKRYADSIDRRANERHILDLSRTAPLQSLTEKELQLDIYPLTTYPRPQRCRVWVRFGPHPFRVEGRVLRTTQLAAGVEFKLEETTFKCWVWGPACEVITLDDVIADRKAHGGLA